MAALTLQMFHPTLLMMTPTLPCLVLNMDPLPLLKLLPPSDSCLSALHLSLQLNLLKPWRMLMFREPSLPSIGMCTAVKWQCEQLLVARQCLDARNQAQCKAGMIPITQTMSQILDNALEDVDQWNIAMDTTPPILSWYLHHSHPYLSNLQPHQLGSWPKFMDHVQKSWCWQLDLPGLPTKSVKIPLKYQSHCSTPPMNSLPKGWVYIEEDVEVKPKVLLNPTM